MTSWPVLFARGLAAIGAATSVGVTLAAPADAALGLPSFVTPPAAQVALGRKLFFDRRLSVNGTLSCAMCHVPAQAFTVNELRTSVGMEGVSLRRNAPSLLNVVFVDRLFLDGRTGSLEAQALQPMLHPDEMANPSLEALMARIAALPDYRGPAARAFGIARLTPPRVAAALASYQRTLVAGGSPFDRWRYGGEADALGAQAQRGFDLFRTLGCVQCHPVGERMALFSDGAFHNVGVQARTEARRARAVPVLLSAGLATEVSPEMLRRIGVPDAADLGREEVTAHVRDRRAFRTPTLRNVALTAPYMHDGSLQTLEAVLEHYASGGSPQDPAQDPRIQPFTLSAPDRAAVLAFLSALTSPAALAMTNEGRAGTGGATND